jgi:Cyclin, N-terminal domain
VKYALSPGYFTVHNLEHVSWRTRKGLINWLVEVAQVLRRQDDTLFLSVTCIDRFLERQSAVEDMQLLGVTCTWLASKHVEVCCPISMQQCADMTAGRYSCEQIVQMEAVVLAELDYSLDAPTDEIFQHYFARFAPVQSDCVNSLASYLLELSLLNEPSCAVWSSLLGAWRWLRPCMWHATVIMRRHAMVTPLGFRV